MVSRYPGQMEKPDTARSLQMAPESGDVEGSAYWRCVMLRRGCGMFSHLRWSLEHALRKFKIWIKARVDQITSDIEEEDQERI